MYKYLRLLRLHAARAGKRSSLRAGSTSSILYVMLALAGATALATISPAHADGDILVDGVGTSLDLGGAGMPTDNPRVAGILAAHPNQFVVICVAGCDGRTKAVQILPKPVTTRTGEVVPSSADMSKSGYGPPVPKGLKANKESNEVVCLAGCQTRPGQVLQRFADLPATAQRVPKKPKDEPAAKAKPKTKPDGSIWDDLIP